MRAHLDDYGLPVDSAHAAGLERMTADDYRVRPVNDCEAQDEINTMTDDERKQVWLASRAAKV